MDIQCSARLNFDFWDWDRYSRPRLKFHESQFRDRVRDCNFLSLTFETETGFFWVSMSRPSPRLDFSESQYRDRVWDWNYQSLNLKTESETIEMVETESLAILWPNIVMNRAGICMVPRLWPSHGRHFLFSFAVGRRWSTIGTPRPLTKDIIHSFYTLTLLRSIFSDSTVSIAVSSRSFYWIFQWWGCICARKELAQASVL